MISAEELRERLYAECGRSVACRRAADYYVALVKNPCYPPADKMTYKVRRHYMQIIERHGPPPKCDVKKLVEERLAGTILEKYAQEIAELAERLRRVLFITSRVAAAVAAVVVAEAHGINVVRHSAAKRFGTNYVSVKTYYRRALRLYREMSASRLR